MTYKTIIKLVKKTYPYVKPYMLQNVLSILLNQLSSGLVLIFPLSLKFLIDDILTAGHWNKMPIFIAIILAITVGSQFTALISNFCYAKFSETVYSDARNQLFEKLVKKDLSFFDKTSDGELVTRLMQDSSNIHVLLSYLLDKFLTNIIKIIFVFFILFCMNPLLALIGVLTVPIFLFLNKKFSYKLRKQVLITRENQTKLTDYYISSFKNIKMIKNFCNETSLSDYGRKINEISKQSQIKAEILGYIMTSIMGTTTSLNQLLVLSIGGIAISRGFMTIGALIAFNTYLAYIYTPFIEITRAYAELNKSIVGLERFFEYDNDNNMENMVKGKHYNRTTGKIVIKSLDFSYKEEQIINNLNLKILPNEKILLLGKSGQGKSTIASLLKRFYTAPNSCIFIDDKDINDLNLQDLRKSIYYLSQDNMFLDATIRENFQMVNQDVTDNEIYEALGKAEIAELLKGKEYQGLDTIIMKNASNFSGGQRERLSIARIFVQSAKIIILDEPFTGIDQVTLMKIWNNMKKYFKNKTVIIIDHHFPDMKYFDKILELKNGKVEEKNIFNY